MHREVKWLVQDHQYWVLVIIHARATHLSLPFQGTCSLVWILQTAYHLSAEQELFAKKINLPTLLILPTLTTGEFFPPPSFDLSCYVHAKSLLSCSVLSKGQLGTFKLCAACTTVLRKEWETKHKLTWVGSLRLPLITKEGWTWRGDSDKSGIPTSGSEALYLIDLGPGAHPLPGYGQLSNQHSRAGVGALGSLCHRPSHLGTCLFPLPSTGKRTR